MAIDRICKARNITMEKMPIETLKLRCCDSFWQVSTYKHRTHIGLDLNVRDAKAVRYSVVDKHPQRHALRQSTGSKHIYVYMARNRLK